MENQLLEVINLDAHYGDAQALWDISFQVARGKITALVGINGAGKSTVLNSISQMVYPSGGEIRFAGESLNKLKPEEVVARGISQVPEGRSLYSRLTVLENLELGAYLPAARPFLKDSLERAFSLFPVLKDRTNQIAGTLSGGEQQMLAIARALMSRPVLLMLDEPSLGLAPMIVGQLFEIIRALNNDGMTILLVEQNIHQTLELSDYAYVLKTGTVKLEGSSAELLADADFQRTFFGITG